MSYKGTDFLVYGLDKDWYLAHPEIMDMKKSEELTFLRENGGFDALLAGIRKVFRGKRGGQLGIGVLVGAMDIATANNTVAIVMANPIAKEMRQEYGISGQRAACLLDTFSCIFQGVIPYGAQMLVAISAAARKAPIYQKPI